MSTGARPSSWWARPAGRGAAGPLSRRALRWTATARRRGQGAGRGPPGDADGRAVRRRRPDRSSRAPGPVPRYPATSPKDHRVRHPRHRRGDQDGRPHRHPQPRRRPRAACTAGGDPPGTGQCVRRGVRRCRARAEAAGADQGLGDRRRRGPGGFGWVSVLEDGELLGWVDEAMLEGKARVSDATPRRFSAYVTAEDSLRQALDSIVTSRTNVAVVVTEGQRYRGILTLERVSREIVS